MLSSSLQYTPLGALSWPIAGTIRDVLITTLPRSVKAVKEILLFLLQGGVVQHAVDLIKGASQYVHARLATALSQDSSAPDTGSRSLFYALTMNS